MKIEDLITETKRAREFAYAPFSKFKIGAAIVSDDGKIYTGCNVENSSFGLTICAERVAIFKAISEGNRNFKTLMVVGEGKEPPVPCGACLQVLSEFTPALKIIMANLEGKWKTATLSQLLPKRFKFKAMTPGKRPKHAKRDFPS